jgi:hypothetical protein
MTLKNDRPMQRGPVRTMTLEEAEEDYSHIDYWLSRPVSERLEALELLRQIVYGYDPDTARLSGPVQIIEPEWCKVPDDRRVRGRRSRP